MEIYKRKTKKCINFPTVFCAKIIKVNKKFLKNGLRTINCEKTIKLEYLWK